MRNILLCMILGFTLALLGCAPPQTAVQITTTRSAVTPLIETQTSLADVVTEIPELATPLTVLSTVLSSPTSALPTTPDDSIATASEVDLAAEAREESRATTIPTQRFPQPD